MLHLVFDAANQTKATPGVCDPSLRYGQPAVRNVAPRSRTSCRSLPPRGCCACSPAKPALRPWLDEEELHAQCFVRRGSGVTLTRAAGEGARRRQTRSKKKAEWSKWPNEQAGLEAVGKRAVEPGASRHRHNRQSRLGQAERSAGPSERSARLRRRTPGNFLW